MKAITYHRDQKLLADRQAPPLVHWSSPPYEKSYCGQPRNSRPMKVGAEPTCVVCIEIRKARRGE